MDFTSKIGKPFGNSLWREAAKIDKLLKDWERTNPDNKTPELEEALFALKQLVAEAPQVDGILPWIWQRLKKGEVTVDADGNVIPVQEEGMDPVVDPEAPVLVPNDQEQLPPQPMSVIHIADWFADKNSPTRRGVDIMQLSPGEVQERVDQWDEELAAKKTEEEEQETLQNQGILYTWGDGSYLRQVQNDEECRELGRNTGNCLRDGGYFDRSAILEYVNAEGKQEVAIEIKPKPGAEKLPNGLNDPRGGTLLQVQAKRGESEGGGYFGNKLPTEEVQRKLREFFQSVDVNDRPMISAGRAKMISEPRTVEEFREWIRAGGDADDFPIADLGEDYVISDEDWESGEGPQSGYIGGYGGPSVEQSSAIFGLPMSAREIQRGDSDPEWNNFVRALALETAQNPEQAIAVLKEVYESLENEPSTATRIEATPDGDVEWDSTRGGYRREIRQRAYSSQLERFQQAIKEELPELEKIFYQNLFYEPLVQEGEDGWYEHSPQAQFEQWPLIQGFGNQTNPFGPLALTRGPNKEPIEPIWKQTNPDQLELPGMPPIPDRHPIFASKKKAKPVYYRWSFSPKEGVLLSANTGQDAFVDYHKTAQADTVDGYAYKTKKGWRLTDREHRAVGDPYVAAQVARKLKAVER